MIPPLELSTIVEKKSKSKCPCCNKKLGLISFTCRCGGNFCAEHRYDTAHSCNYDFQGEAKRKLSADLVKVVGDKLNRL